MLFIRFFSCSPDFIHVEFYRLSSVFQTHHIFLLFRISFSLLSKWHIICVFKTSKAVCWFSGLKSSTLFSSMFLMLLVSKNIHCCAAVTTNIRIYFYHPKMKPHKMFFSFTCWQPVLETKATSLTSKFNLIWGKCCGII